MDRALAGFLASSFGTNYPPLPPFKKQIMRETAISKLLEYELLTTDRVSTYVQNLEKCNL